jgi:hypothetical protein
MRRILLAVVLGFAIAAPAFAGEPVYEYSCDDVADLPPPPHPNLLAGAKRPEAAPRAKAEAKKENAPGKKRALASVQK